jgi:hypothetical protein
MDRRTIVVALLSSAFMSGCAPLAGSSYCRHPPDPIFFTKSYSEQVRLAESLPVEQQYEFYWFSRRCDEPPNSSIAGAIAKGGAKSVPFLKARLEAAQSYGETSAIVDMFMQMKISRSYDVAGDAAVMDLLYLKLDNTMRDVQEHVYLAYMIEEILRTHRYMGEPRLQRESKAQ